MRAFTDDELIRRVWDVEEIKVAYKRVFFLANEWRQKELDEAVGVRPRSAEDRFAPTPASMWAWTPSVTTTSPAGATTRWAACPSIPCPPVWWSWPRTA